MKNETNFWINIPECSEKEKEGDLELERWRPDNDYDNVGKAKLVNLMMKPISHDPTTTEVRPLRVTAGWWSGRVLTSSIYKIIITSSSLYSKNRQQEKRKKTQHELWL